MILKQPRLRTWVGETQQKRPERDGRKELSSGWSWRLKGGMITQGLETVAEPSGSRLGECVHFFEIYSLNLLQNNLPQSLWLKGTGIYSLTVWCLKLHT